VLGGLVAIGVVTAVALAATTAGGRGLSAPPSPPPSPSPGTSWPGWGFTHTQYSADTGTSSAVRSVQQALARQPLVQAQAIMGWGAGNPEPSPGVYDFASLDSRIRFIERSGGIPAITLCCAPDWMKGGRPGRTDWNELTRAPLPAHDGDFAHLAAVIARRYPEVRYFLVWNEFKGFWSASDNAWDAAGYTDLYNAVYDAVKRADPKAQVGGPYLPMAAAPGATGPGSVARSDPTTLSGTWGAVDPRILAAFRYWLAHAHGGDFIAVDGHADATGAVDPFAATEKFAAVTRWIRRQSDLPVWWAEWYVDESVTRWPADQQLAAYTAAMIQLALGGSRAALYWNPTPGDASCAGCLWTDTTMSGGGRPLPLLTGVLQRFARWFPPGTPLRHVAAPPGLLVLAQAHAMVAVNTSGSTVAATVAGHRVDLAPRTSTWLTDL
jgi:hypothetical protein